MTTLSASCRAAGLAVLLLIGGAAQAGGPLDADIEMALGAADAPVTIVEFASMTCPHCARFHLDELPSIKKAYIDSGKVRLVFSEFPLDRLALAASKVARCGGERRFFAFIDLMFRDQREWAGDPDPIGALRRLARLGGLGSTDFDACLANEELEKGLLRKALDASKAHSIQSTPSFVINGELHDDQLTAANMDDVLQPLLP